MKFGLCVTGAILSALGGIGVGSTLTLYRLGASWVVASPALLVGSLVLVGCGIGIAAASGRFR